MPAGNVAGCRAAVRRTRVFGWRRKLSIMLRGQESKYFLHGWNGLIGEKHVAGVLEHDEPGARNPAGNQLTVARRYETV